MVGEFAKVSVEVSFNNTVHAIEDPNPPFQATRKDYMGGAQDNFENPFRFKLLQNATKRKKIAATRFPRMFARMFVP